MINERKDMKFLSPPTWRIETTSYDIWKFDVKF